MVGAGLAMRLSHSTGKKIPATNYTVFYRYFRAEYRYPHGTAVPVWTPNLNPSTSAHVKRFGRPFYEEYLEESRM